MKQQIQPHAKTVRNAHQGCFATRFSAFQAVTAVFPLFRGSAIHRVKLNKECENEGKCLRNNLFPNCIYEPWGVF